MSKFPLHRFNEFVSLNADEIEAVENLVVERRHLKRHDIIRAQGDPVQEVYLLEEGWAGSCVDVVTGTRQMVRVHLPGDMVGTPSVTLSKAAETLVALSRAIVGLVPLAAYSKLFMSNPRIAAAMFLTAQKERILLMDRLTSIGRTNAAQRLAAFLLNIHERLAIAGFQGPTFQLPLSQDELADVLGITSVHTNRTLAQLVKAGFIRRHGKTITMLDIDGLRSFGAVPQRRFERLPEWNLAPDSSRAPRAGTMVRSRR